MAMYCADREHLIARFETATREYMKAVNALAGKRSRDFEIAYHASERLRTDCEDARFALERHSLEHGCGHAERPGNAVPV